MSGSTRSWIEIGSVVVLVGDQALVSVRLSSQQTSPEFNWTRQYD